MRLTRSTEKTDPRIIAEQVAMLYRMGPYALRMSWLGATTVMALFLMVAPPGPLIAWYAAMHVTYAVRYTLIRAYRRASPTAEGAHRWGRYFVGGTLCAGVTWGLLGTPLIPVGDYSQQVIFCVVNVAVSALTSGASTRLRVISRPHRGSQPSA